MMEQFRKFGATKASKAMLTLLVACFAAWGIGGYLMPTLGAEAITVNGEGVSPQMVEQTFKQRLDNISQLLGTKPTQEQMDQMQVPEQIVAEVVARTALRQTAEKLGFVAATQQLQNEIMMVSAFKNEQGKFDVARYRQILQQAGRSPAQFEHDLSQDIIVRNMAQLAKVELPDPALAAIVAASEDAKMTLDVATFSPEALGAVDAPTATEIEKFYNDNKETYSKPESRDLVVLRVSREDMMKSIDVPEKDVMAAYETNKASYKLPEERTVRHILLDSREAALKAATGIKTLAEFEKAANTLSKDPGNQGKGGSLGTIQEKDVVPAFGKVAFKLPVNSLSEPVQSNFGWHLIWVEKIDPAREMSFADMKEAIAKDLKEAQADEALERVVALVDTKVAGGEDLSKIAAEVGVKPLQFNTVTAADTSVDPQEREAGFSVPEGKVSVPISMRDGGAAYVQATKVTPSKVLPLAEVKDRVVKDWSSASVQSKLRQNADKLLSAARAPGAKGSLAELAAKAGVLGMKTETVVITKPDETPEWLQRNLLEVYPLAQGAVLAGVLPEKANLHVVRMASRTMQTPDANMVPELAKVYQQRLQGDVEALLMSYVTQHSHVKLNQAYLKQIFGREVVWDITESR